jgi:hypothetical protein
MVMAQEKNLTWLALRENGMTFRATRARATKVVGTWKLQITSFDLIHLNPFRFKSHPSPPTLSVTLDLELLTCPDVFAF